MYGVSVRRTNIYLDDADLRALRSVGDLQGRSVAELVREAVAEWLVKHGVRRVDDDEWQRRFGELLEERRKIAVASDRDPEEIERDVVEAIREVREARAARRR